MSLELLRFVHRESGQGKLLIAVSSFMAGSCRGSLIATINAAAVLAADGRVSAVHVATFCALLFGFLAAKYLADSWTQLLLGRMQLRLRLRLCGKLVSASLPFIEERGLRRGGGELFANITHDINTIASTTVRFINTFQNAVLLLFCLAYIGWLSLPGLGATLVAMATGIWLHLHRERIIKVLLVRARENQAEFFTAIGDLIRGFKEIKLNRNRCDAISGHVESIAEEYRQLALRTELATMRSTLATQSITFILVGLLVFVIPTVSEVESVRVFQFLAAILFMIGPLEEVVSAIPVFNRANIALERITGLEAAMDDTHRDSGKSQPTGDLAQFTTIRLRGVTYRFATDESDDQFQLGPLDLELRRGQVLLIVGGNGSGKTTLLKLLTGLYSPDAGTVEVDGTPLPPECPQAYRDLFATVFGDFHLFQFLYGIEPPPTERIDPMLSELGLDRKIHLNDDRISTIALSTGQRKRLAYLVSRLEDRAVYILDEFAADQDPQFRRFFYRELLEEMRRQGKTVVAVTHDDHYFDAGDRVVKLDYGKVVPYSTQPDASRA